MKISLSEIMNLPNITKEFECLYGPDSFVVDGVTHNITEKSNFIVKIANRGNKMIGVSTETEVSFELSCDRCLKSVKVSVPAVIDIDVDMNKTSEERATELDETAFIESFDLDVDHMISEELLMNFPMKVLCKEDCKGICTVCGHDLNEGECGCDRAILDPRMAAIAEMFKAKNQNNQKN